MESDSTAAGENSGAADKSGAINESGNQAGAENGGTDNHEGACACSGGCAGAKADKSEASCCCGNTGGKDGACGGCAGEEIVYIPPKSVSDGDGPYFVVSVHYSKMGITENFVADFPGIRLNDMVIVKSSRGEDFGIVVHKPMPSANSPRGLGEVIRIATESDKNLLEHIEKSKESEELAYCKSKVAERDMPMKMAGIEHLFGGDKIIFYFLADGRVDFRELVKDLARRYRTRIEMRQIGVRDEARMLSDYEHCGRELCCRSFIRELEPVTMRMAKIQKSTLDPTKISGHCGRLMCCLRFEDEVYKENKKSLPYKNDLVETGEVSGRVLSTETLSQNVTIELRDGSREVINANDIISRKKNVPVAPNTSPRDKRNDSQKPREPQARSNNNSDKKNDSGKGEDDKENSN